jgi:hypothetical protein
MKVRIVILCVAWLSVAPATVSAQKIPEGWLAAAYAADSASSLYAFHYGAGEANPLVLSTKPFPFLVQNISHYSLERWALKRLAKNHPKLARVSAWASVSVRAAVVVNNVWVARRQRQLYYGGQ